MEGQLTGSKQQLQLVQDRLSSNSAAQAEAPLPNASNTNVQPHTAALEQGYGLNQQYSSDQQYAADHAGTDADMDFEPPGSAGALDRYPSFDPTNTEGQDSGLDGTGREQARLPSPQQDQGQDELYSPGLSAQPSGSYMSDPSFQGNPICLWTVPSLNVVQLHQYVQKTCGWTRWKAAVLTAQGLQTISISITPHGNTQGGLNPNPHKLIT